jgi:hypothetical protein
LEYCRVLDLPAAVLKTAERLAWGAAVHAALLAAHAGCCGAVPNLTCAPTEPLGRPSKNRRPRQAKDTIVLEAYRLVVYQHVPRKDVCQRLGISLRTLNRYLQLERRAMYGA